MQKFNSIYYTAYLLDTLSEEDLFPDNLSITMGDGQALARLDFDFDQLSSRQRYSIKRLAESKFKKNSYSGSIEATQRKVFPVAEGPDFPFHITWVIKSVYVCEQVCRPKHHSPEVEAEFLAE